MINLLSGGVVKRKCGPLEVLDFFQPMGRKRKVKNTCEILSPQE